MPNKEKVEAARFEVMTKSGRQSSASKSQSSKIKAKGQSKSKQNKDDKIQSKEQSKDKQSPVGIQTKPRGPSSFVPKPMSEAKIPGFERGFDEKNNFEMMTPVPNQGMEFGLGEISSRWQLIPYSVLINDTRSEWFDTASPVQIIYDSSTVYASECNTKNVVIMHEGHRSYGDMRFSACHLVTPPNDRQTGDLDIMSPPLRKNFQSRTYILESNYKITKGGPNNVPERSFDCRSKQICRTLNHAISLIPKEELEHTTIDINSGLRDNETDQNGNRTIGDIQEDNIGRWAFLRATHTNSWWRNLENLIRQYTKLESFDVLDRDPSRGQAFQKIIDMVNKYEIPSEHTESGFTPMTLGMRSMIADRMGRSSLRTRVPIEKLTSMEMFKAIQTALFIDDMKCPIVTSTQERLVAMLNHGFTSGLFAEAVDKSGMNLEETTAKIKTYIAKHKYDRKFPIRMMHIAGVNAFTMYPEEQLRVHLQAHLDPDKPLTEKEAHLLYGKISRDEKKIFGSPEHMTHKERQSFGIAHTKNKSSDDQRIYGDEELYAELNAKLNATLKEKSEALELQQSDKLSV